MVMIIENKSSTFSNSLFVLVYNIQNLPFQPIHIWDSNDLEERYNQKRDVSAVFIKQYKDVRSGLVGKT